MVQSRTHQRLAPRLVANYVLQFKSARVRVSVGALSVGALSVQELELSAFESALSLLSVRIQAYLWWLQSAFGLLSSVALSALSDPFLLLFVISGF